MRMVYGCCISGIAENCNDTGLVADSIYKMFMSLPSNFLISTLIGCEVSVLLKIKLVIKIKQNLGKF